MAPNNIDVETSLFDDISKFQKIRYYGNFMAQIDKHERDDFIVRMFIDSKHGKPIEFYINISRNSEIDDHPLSMKFLTNPSHYYGLIGLDEDEICIDYREIKDLFDDLIKIINRILCPYDFVYNKV